MKKFAGTYGMAAAVVLLAAYTYWEYQHAREDLEAAKGERLAFTIKREDVDELQLNLRGQLTVLKREGDVWKFVKPVEDLAEGSAVEGYLFSVLSQHVKAFRSDEEAKETKWAEFGLDPAGATIEVSAKGKKEGLAVSTKNAFDGNFYVRQKDELVLGDRTLAQLADRPASSLRSRHLWRDEDAHIDRVTIENSMANQKFTFVKEGPNWHMDPKPAFAIDTAKFEAWMNKVEELLPSDFVKEGIEPQDKADSLLVKPSEVITFDYKKKDGSPAQWVLTLGQDKAEEVYLYTNQRPTLYKTSKSSVDPILVSSVYFRDGKAPFQFEVEQARELTLHLDKSNYKFKKGDSGWRIEDGPKDSQLDQEKLVQFFTILRSLEAQEFVTAGTGFKTPQIEVRGDKGQVLFSLTWGDEFKAKNPWNMKAALRFVKTSVGKDVMGVEKSKLDRLVDPRLVTVPKPQKAGVK